MLLQELGMEDAWKKNELTKKAARQWRATIREKITEREERQWKERMQHKPKLRTYRQLKTRLHFEHRYLNMRDREAREVMTRLRGGTNELRIETGRYPITNRDRSLDVEERKCLICLSGEIEDEAHFMLDCAMYEDMRQKMFDMLKSMMLEKQQRELDVEKERKEKEGRQKLMTELIGETSVADNELAAAVLLFCKRAMRRRKALVRTILDQRT